MRHFWLSDLAYIGGDPGQHPRHVDYMWPVWTILNRSPEGRGSDWGPELEYR
jgi:predicted dithiol-disulfide oxidoreductase (DUF899 family)